MNQTEQSTPAAQAGTPAANTSPATGLAAAPAPTPAPNPKALGVSAEQEAEL